MKRGSFGCLSIPVTASPELIEGQLGTLELLSEEWRWVRAAVTTQSPPPSAPSVCFFRCLKAVMGPEALPDPPQQLPLSTDPRAHRCFNCLPLCWKGRECGWGGLGRGSAQWSPVWRSWGHLLHPPRVGGGSCWAETPYLRVKLWKLCSGSHQQPRSRARGAAWPPPLLIPARTFPMCLGCVQAELCTKLVWEGSCRLRLVWVFCPARWNSSMMGLWRRTGMLYLRSCWGMPWAGAEQEKPGWAGGA